MVVTRHRVLLSRVVHSEVALEIYADDAKEAERMARGLVPEDGREWVVANREVTVVAEESGAT